MKHDSSTRGATLVAGLTAGFLGMGLSVSLAMINDVGWDEFEAALPYIVAFLAMSGTVIGLGVGLVASLLLIRWAPRLPSRGVGRLIAWAGAIGLAGAPITGFILVILREKDLLLIVIPVFAGLGTVIAFLAERWIVSWTGAGPTGALDRPRQEPGHAAGGEASATDEPTDGRTVSAAGRSREARRLLGPRMLALIVVLAANLALLFFMRYQSRPAPQVELTDDTFAAIQLGMSLKEVEQVLGGRGTESGPFDDDRTKYSWRDLDFETNQSVVWVTFEDDVAIKKDRTVPAGAFDVASIAMALHSPNPVERQAAFSELSGNRPDLGAADTAEAVILGLSDHDPNVRQAAAWSVRTISQNYRAHRDLGQALPYDWPADAALRGAILRAVDDSNEEVAGIAIRALYLLYAPADDIREVLVSRFSTTGGAALKVGLLQAVGLHGYDDAEVFALLEAARTDSNPAVRSAAARATARCRVPDAASLIESMLQDAKDPTEREDLQHALSLVE